MNKYILLILIVFFLFQNSKAQSVECDTHFEAKDTIYLPHYGQNYILDSLLMITRRNANPTIMSGSNILFHIPIKIWLYHDDEGFGHNDALSEAEVYQLIDSVNSNYERNNTGIRFYLKCEIEHVFSTEFNTLNSEDEFDEMLNTNYDPRAHNWHLITRMYDGLGGRGIYPWRPQPHFSFAVEFSQGELNEEGISLTIHEIGHTLGLLHTHDNIRGTGDYNGDASMCYQESVSRTRTQGIGCLFTYGQKKCEINGDALCDTEAAPNTEDVMNIETDFHCNYIGSGTDRWDDEWDPPVTNIMSYVDRHWCRTEFTEGQIGVMHSNIILHMKDPRCPFLGELWCQPWYNTHSLSLSETVPAGEERSYILSESIQAGGSSSYVISSGGSAEFTAGNTVKLKPGFHAKPGANFRAKAGAITNCDEVFTNYPALYTNREHELQTLSQDSYSRAYRLLQEASDRNNNKSSNDTKAEKEYQNKADLLEIIIYPNPANTHISIQIPDVPKQQIKYRLYNTQGLLLSEIRSSEPQVQMSVSHFPEGIYILKIAGNSINKSQKIVLKR